ncbi:MAG: putative DNA binding domain-containing protein [Desulfobacterales bacterium]|nr:putative DNA binding domain-containing protein [Desulfobacterales bacterium]
MAFANTDGGRVFVGMDDSGNISGINIGPETEQRYINEIKVATYPQIIPKTFIFEEGGKKALVFEINEYPVKPVAYKNRYYKRVKNSNHLLSLEEIVDLQQQSLQISYDAYPADVDVTDLDKNLIDRFCQKINDIGRVSILDDPLSNLAKLKLISKSKPSLAALLLFGDHNYSIHIGRFKSKETIIDDLVLKEPLMVSLEQTMMFIKKHINLSFDFDGGLARKETWQFPLEAVRELLLNTVVHRDYKNTSDIVIKIFDDRIEFTNPGTLYGKLRIEDLVRDDYVSSIRNKLLAESFFLLGDIEKYGTGFIRVRKYLEEYPGLCLEINEIGDYFKVVLIDKDASETEKAGTGQAPGKHRTSTGQAPDKLSLLAYCRHPRTIREIMDHFSLRHRETFMNNHLRPLIEKGLIRMTIPDKPTSPKQKYLTTKTGAEEILPDETDR